MRRDLALKFFDTRKTLLALLDLLVQFDHLRIERHERLLRREFRLRRLLAGVLDVVSEQIDAD